MEKDLSNLGPGRLVSGGVWFLGLMILSGIFWLLLGVQVSRAYGPSGFGLFSMAYSVFDFLWALIFGGLFEGLIHFGAGYLTKKDANLSQLRKVSHGNEFNNVHFLNHFIFSNI